MTMTRWDVKRVGLVAAFASASAGAGSFAVCAALGSLTANALGTALLICSMLMGIVASVLGGGITRYNPGWGNYLQAHRLGQGIDNERLPPSGARHLRYELAQQRDFSWTLVSLLAAIPVFAASMVLKVGFD